MTREFFRSKWTNDILFSDDGVFYTNIRTGFKFKPTGMDAVDLFERVVGVKTRFGGIAGVTDILCSANGHYFAVDGGHPLRIGENNWSFITEPIVVEPRWSPMTSPEKIRKWGKHVVRGAENIKVGHAYRYIYGGANVRGSYDSEIFVVVSVDKSAGTFDVVSLTGGDWRLERDNQYIDQRSFKDSGIVVANYCGERNAYNTNWMVPAHVKPSV